MTPREERGLIIAAVCKLNRTPSGWLVPSQSGERIYTVNPTTQTCTCPDHQESGFKCKHLFAVEITMKREMDSDGNIIETKTLTLTEKKVYRQDWPAYNLAQATEKRRVQVLLHDLCRKLPERERSADASGPKPHLTRDAVFAMAFKVYCGLSCRRFSTDLLDAHEKGHISRPIPGVKVPAFFEDPYFTPILKELIGQSARPLRAVESDFAIDSSGFGSSRHERWYDQKYGVTRTRCIWVKTHIACGVKTNVVTAVRILDKEANDCPQFVPLVKETKRHFEIGEVSADKAYVSLENFEEVAGCGGQAFIAFKSNTTGGVGGMLEKAFHFFRFNQEEYMAKYHKRSNVESTFSAVKRKFGPNVLSRTDTAMVNEVLCKFLCHNLTCLIMEQETLGIVPIFWKDEPQETGDAPTILSMVPAQRI
jgi:transposase